jgi:4-amino-4-deoxy-L-arabinose transferase-like glycosyltransferase
VSFLTSDFIRVVRTFQAEVCGNADEEDARGLLAAVASVVSEHRPRLERGRRGRSTLGLALTRRPNLALLLVLGMFYVPWAASIPLDGTLEGNRLEAAREMLQSGDWLVPTLGGTVYLAKPPLHPWTLALLARPLGDVSVAGGRAVSIAAAIATCYVVARWGRRELGRRTGTAAAFALGTAFVFAEKGLRAELESELTLFSTLALLALWDATRRRERSVALSVVSGLALAAAVLVKGPPPLIVYLAAACALCTATNERRAVLAAAGPRWRSRSCVRWPGSCPFASGSGSRVPGARCTNSSSNASSTRDGRTWRRSGSTRRHCYSASCLRRCSCPSSLSSGRSVETVRRENARASCGAGLCCPSCSSAMSDGKETRYLLPTLPAWSLLLAWGWTRARTSCRFVGWRTGLARGLRAVSWIAPFAWAVVGWLRYPEARIVVTASAACALAGRAAFDWSERSQRPTAALLAVLIVLGAGKVAWAGTALARQRSASPLADVGSALAARLAPDEPWILVGPYRSWLHFAVNRPCVDVQSVEYLEEARRRCSARYLFAREDSIPAGTRGLEREERWSIDGEPYGLYRVDP